MQQMGTAQAAQKGVRSQQAALARNTGLPQDMTP